MKSVINKLKNLVMQYNMAFVKAQCSVGNTYKETYDAISIVDIVILKDNRISNIKELNSSCEFGLQVGTWYVVTVFKKQQVPFDDLIKQCYAVFPPNISCQDREGNKLLFYYANFKDCNSVCFISKTTIVNIK